MVLYFSAGCFLRAGGAPPSRKPFLKRRPMCFRYLSIQYSIEEILPQFQYNFYGPRWSKPPLLSLVASYVQCLVLVYAWTSWTIHNFAPSWQDNRKRHIASCQLHSVAKNKLAWRCKDSTTGKNPQ